MTQYGLGYDIHRLAKGRRLFLGGVLIPHKKGLLGHSDADVLLHAVCDSLLGAIGERDIGYHFPVGSAAYKDISSLILLKKVHELLSKKKYRVNNLDTVVVAEAPKIGPYISKMKKNIAGILKIDEKKIGIKATTNEKVGLIGSGRAIAAFSIASVKKG